MHRAFVGIIVGLVLLSQVGGMAVLAHEDAVATDPAAGSTIPEAPERVTVSFVGEIDPEGSAIQVVGPDGEHVNLGDGGVDLNNPDRNTLVAGLPPDLPAGEYTVEWVAVSAGDTHPEEGSFTFTVDPDAPPANASGAVDSAVEAPEGDLEPVGGVAEDVDDAEGFLEEDRGALILAVVTIAVGLGVAASIGRRFWWR